MIKQISPALLCAIRRSCLSFSLFILLGCAAIDPNHVYTRNIGNAAPPAGVNLSSETRQHAYNFVWNRINDAYFDPHLRGIDWKTLGQEHQPKILLASSDDIFWKNMDDMVAELGDAHTRVLSSKQYAYYKEKQSLSLGLNLVELNGEIVVASILKDSAADKAGIVRGNKLLEIDGIAAPDWWHLQLSKTRKNSTERARLKSVKRLFNNGDPELSTHADSSTLHLKIEDNHGLSTEINLSRTVLTKQDSLTSKLLDNGMGYLRLSGFDAKLSSEIAASFEKIKYSSALVIDLRGNGGGSLDLSMAIMNQLVPAKVQIGKRITRNGKTPAVLFGLISTGELELVLQGTKEPYQAPVVILIDGDSASASELFASSLQDLGRAKVLGETSCGCLLGYMGYANVPGGGALAYSEIGFELAKGKIIEGVGVIPDRSISLKREDLVANKDQALEAAMLLLQSMLAASSGQAQESANRE